MLYGECAGRLQSICESLGLVCRTTDEDCKTDNGRANIFGALTSPICRPAIAVAEDPMYEQVDAIDVPDKSQEDEDQPISPEPSGLSRPPGYKYIDDCDCVSGICSLVTEMS